MAKYHTSYVETSPFFRKTARMPSPRRIKVYAILVSLALVTFLLWSASLRQRRVADLRSAGDFYYKTLNALGSQPDARAAADGGAGVEDSQEVKGAMSERLKEAAQVAKDKANKKAPKPDDPAELVGVGNARKGQGDEKGVAGRKKYQAPVGPQEPLKDDKAEEDEEEDIEAQNELVAILKKGPIIIFSKSYCPHSRRAKGILLDKYIIDPVPVVVELDKHPMGSRLQDQLQIMTGRRTVPNVIIDGISIGGGDDVAALDNSHALIEKVRLIGGKKIDDIRLRPIDDDEDDDSHGLR